MKTNDKDALAVVDREISARQLGSSGHAVGCVEHPPGAAFPCSCNGPQLVATRSALAKLIEASRRVQEQVAPLLAQNGYGYVGAMESHRAALRSCGGLK